MIVKPNITSSAAVLLFVFGAGDVLAQGACTAGLTAAQLVTTLSGKYVCAKRPGPVDSDTWNELHQGTTAAGGPILDYKRGPSDPVDPSKVVGTYIINANNTVTYNYGDPGGPYTWVVTGGASPNPETPGFQFCNIATGALIPAIISTTPVHAFCASP